MKILAAGHALVDYFITDDGELPISLGLHSGSYSLVTDERMSELLEKCPSVVPVPGGLAANVLRLSSQMGLSAEFFGVCGDNEAGQTFTNGMVEAGVSTNIRMSNGSTGKSLVIFGNSRRTVVTHRGSASQLKVEDLSSEALAQTDWAFLEGYLMEEPKTYKSFLAMIKKQKKQVVFDPGEANIILHQDELVDWTLEQGLDILICNEMEALALTKQDNVQEAVNLLLKSTETLVLKKGSAGCSLYSHNQQNDFPAIGSALPDGAGAGDGFAAGFFYGLHLGLNLEKSVACAQIMAANILAGSDTVLTEKQKNQIKNDIHKL